MTWDVALPDFFACLRVTSWPELLGAVFGAMGQCWRPSRKSVKNQLKACLRLRFPLGKVSEPPRQATEDKAMHGVEQVPVQQA